MGTIHGAPPAFLPLFRNSHSPAKPLPVRRPWPQDSLTRAVLLHLQVSFFLFIIFVVYTMLPFNMRDAIIASVLTSSSHTIVLSVCLSTTPGAKDPLVWQVGDVARPVGDGGGATLLRARLGGPGSAQALLCDLDS